MDKTTVEKLLTLNLKFYQTFASDFSETRQRLQPGVLRLLDFLEPGAAILDLGCGNGELARELARRGFPGTYTGVDFSSALLEEARQSLPADFPSRFLELDLAQEDWEPVLQGEKFAVILALAVFHHLPGAALHRQVCSNIYDHLADEGAFYLSNWQFLKSERLRSRTQPWSKVDLHPDQVGEDDYLLDWRRGGLGLRYVRYFTEEALQQLAEDTGFEVAQTYYSDGKRGDLSIYQKWVKAHPPG
jgi:SAM-dependent methyltransferase